VSVQAFLAPGYVSTVPEPAPVLVLAADAIASLDGAAGWDPRPEPIGPRHPLPLAGYWRGVPVYLRAEPGEAPAPQ